MKRPLYANMKMASCDGSVFWPAAVFGDIAKHPKRWARCTRHGDTFYWLATPAIIAWFYRRCRQIKQTNAADYAILAPRFKTLFAAAKANWSAAERDEFDTIIATNMAVASPRPPPDWALIFPAATEPSRYTPAIREPLPDDPATALYWRVRNEYPEFFPPAFGACSAARYVWLVGSAIRMGKKIPPLVAQLYRVYKERADPRQVRHLKKTIGWPAMEEVNA